MELTAKTESIDGKVILRLAGILDLSTVEILNQKLTELGTFHTLILDFSELEFIDSTGIGSIMEGIRLSQEQQFKLVLQNIDEATYDVLETVGLFNILAAVKGEVV